VIPEAPDLPRMRRERHAKLQQQLEAHDLDGLLLLTTSAVSYATGAHSPGSDSSRAGLMRTVAAVVRGESFPHLFTAFPEGAPGELPPAHVRPCLFPDLEDGIADIAGVVSELFGRGARVGIDEQTHPLLSAAPDLDLVSASGVLGAAKICKTPDELACIRRAQRINELAMFDVQGALSPGVRQTDLTAVFLRRIYELGATSNGIDPIWQAMPLAKTAGPWTVHGDVAFPTPTTDRFLREGEVVWVDTGISYEGYASDFGRTWIVGSDPRPSGSRPSGSRPSGTRPSGRQRAQYERWADVVGAVLAICKPGVTALELDQAAVSANGGTRPWLEHFYLAHGVGTDNAEMPLIGTDLGEAFDEQLVLAPGMVLVLEPVIWDEGAAGYRSEDIVAVTEDGWVSLSDYPYDPFGPLG
jgi:Xaa-Pro aminopeptidase